MVVQYIRCSAIDQNPIRQQELGKEYGVEKVYLDMCSGKDTNRPQLKEMLEFLREGDVCFTESISRIARHTRDLLAIMDLLKEKKVTFVSHKEKIDTSTTTGRFMLTVFGAIAEMERETILERQAEGIAIAKQNGVYKGRTPRKIDMTKYKIMMDQWRRNERTATSIMREFNITPTTFYRWVKEKK